MKTSIKCLFAFLMVVQSTISFAQIDNRVNFSPEWIRSGTRNASNDAVDAAVFNPGALATLPDGFHFAIGNQSLFRKPSHEYNLGDVPVTSAQDGNDMVFPNVYASYGKNKWALSTGLFVSGGGATANFPSGSFSTDLIGFMALGGAMGAYTVADDQYMEASSFYLTSMLGASYELSDKLSIGANVRYLTAMNETSAGLTLSGSPMALPDMPLAIKSTAEATGMGASFGVFYRPSEKWSFAARYDMMVPLEFTTEVEKDDFGLFTDGQKDHRDLPAVLATGAKYAIKENLRAELDFNYYFQTGADWGKSSVITEERAISAMAGDAYSTGLGLEYDVNESLLVSLGALYTIFDFDDVDGYYTTLGAFETAPGTNFSINTGLRYRFSETIALNAGVSQVMWEDQEIKALVLSPMDVTVKTSNSMTAVGIGLNVSF
jgi:long-chain fatty acid transport protein